MSSHSRYDRIERAEGKGRLGDSRFAKSSISRDLSGPRRIRVPVTKIRVTHDMTGMVEVSAPSSKALGSWVYGFV